MSRAKPPHKLVALTVMAGRDCEFSGECTQDMFRTQKSVDLQEHLRVYR